MRFAVLASGNGSNLGALLDAQARGELAPAEVAVVIVNRPNALALTRARAASVPAIEIDHTAFGDRSAFEAAVIASVIAHRAEGIVLAGFMRVLTAEFVQRFPRRIINTHPSLLPAFPGTGAARQALDYGARVTGCSIHFVDATLDGGAVIAQAAVAVFDTDTEETLQARIQREEHRLLPCVVRALAANEISGEGRRVVITGQSRSELLPTVLGVKA